MWNLSEFVKTVMITQNKGEWPTCLALTSVTEQSSSKSSNPIYLSLVMILSLKIPVSLSNLRRVSVKFAMPEQKMHFEVAESLKKKKKKHSSNNERLHLTAVTNNYVKKGLHEIIENRIKKAATKRWW